jgi:hypothetical protein
MRRAEVLRRCTIAPGDEVAVTIDGGGTRFLARGWSPPEPDFTWTDGHSAEIAVRAAHDLPASEPVQLSLTVAALVDERNPRQRIDASVDGEPATSWTLDHGGEVTFNVRLGPLGARPRIVRLDLPDACPQPVDPRVLAIRLLRLRLDRVS